MPAGKKKLEFLENPISTLLGYSRISNLIQAYFWDFHGIACWYWPDLAIFQADKLGIGRINLNFRQECGFQEKSSLSGSLKIQAQCQVNGAKSKKIQAANTSKLFQENPRRAWIIFPAGNYWLQPTYCSIQQRCIYSLSYSKLAATGC